MIRQCCTRLYCCKNLLYEYIKISLLAIHARSIINQASNLFYCGELCDTQGTVLSWLNLTHVRILQICVCRKMHGILRFQIGRKFMTFWMKFFSFKCQFDWNNDRDSLLWWCCCFTADVLHIIMFKILLLIFSVLFTIFKQNTFQNLYFNRYINISLKNSKPKEPFHRN